MALELKFPITKSPKPPFEISHIDNTIKSTTEDGYQLVRPRFTKIRKTIKLKWDIINQEYLTLESFYTTTTVGGAVPFNLVFKTIGGSTEDSGIQFDLDVRFAEKPKFTYLGMGVWEVECNFTEL
jgi:hypothetical protein